MTPVDRLVTGPPDISIEEAERRMLRRRVEKLPLVDADRRIRGLITKKDILVARHRPYSSKDARGRLLVARRSARAATSSSAAPSCSARERSGTSRRDARGLACGAEQEIVIGAADELRLEGPAHGCLRSDASVRDRGRGPLPVRDL